MTASTPYIQLMEHLKSTEALSQISQLLSWDQEAAMPKRGAEARSEQVGALESVLHAKRTDPRIADWLNAAEDGDLSPAEQANLRLTRLSYERAVKVPAALAEELSKVTSRAVGVWSEAKDNSDFKHFEPTLKRILELSRERAACLRHDGQSLYDALLDEYELGASESSVSDIFGRLRTGLTKLRAQIEEKTGQEPQLKGHFPQQAQLALSKELATGFGYDVDAGRIDLVVHPFCSGTRGDVRITTRVDERDPLNCLYSTIHETGHALYEQGLNPDLAWQPAGGHASMGVHESQSRLCENQIGRSLAYSQYLYPKMVETFGALTVADSTELYQALNVVSPGFIRTEADEVHYNLHIMLRFELERLLINGALEVSDLEAAWNDRFEADFGRKVPGASNGILQDVHWAFGGFGYFPTYTLGNIYAGCLYAALRNDFNDFDDLVRNGDLKPVVAWLREKIHVQGSVHEPADMMMAATGKSPDEKPLLAYLNTKFGELYNL